ncbi:eukaryotic translation initiation factor 4Ba isoform X3 [Tachysurus fulvidraco]|uniref:eukaryotic translation initiation factor 4Ba isoform X3 n=1 Tax=Tachysurus fulvidraco TaxID=1234273 RepID=UPI000F4E35A3|nr:eukaryotic translation initiation factor 4Ba isoform X3 [Tachysurus fulvidraco]
MAASAAKKKGKKGKTLTLTDFLAEDSGGNPVPNYTPAKPTSWADETDDLEGDVTTSWHTEEDVYRAPPIDRSILPTAPRAAREPNVDRSRLPRCPPYTAFLGNLPYDVTEESITSFFHGLNISAVRLPREPSNPERLKGFGYAEFDDVESLLRALSLNEENLGNRRIRVDIADQSNDKDDRSMSGRDRNRSIDMGPDKTDSDWRARPSGDVDEGPRKDDGYGERSRDRYDSDRYRDGPRRDNDRYDGGRDRYRERYDDRDRRDYDRGYDSRGGGGGRRPFGSGFRRDYDDRRDDYRGSGDRYGDRYGDREDRTERRDEKREDRGPLQRPKLNLKPRSVPKDEDQSSARLAASSRSASIFGGAKPVDTASKEREVEERLKKEQERLQRQLDEDKGRPERNPRERHPSWRSDDQATERSRTGSESSQPGNTTGRGSRRRESERSLENEVFSGRDDEPPSPGSHVPSSKQDGLSLKVVPAPPPKENAWAKRSAMSSGSSENEVKPGPPKSSTSSADERVPQKVKDENKGDCPRRGRGGAPAPAAGRERRKETDRKDVRRERDLRPAPGPKKYEESPSPKFSSASKYAALLMDGEGDDAEEN